MLKVSEALAIMRTPDQFGKPVPFSIEYVLLDKKKKQQGRKIFLPSAIVPVKNLLPKESTNTTAAPSASKNPNHGLHNTVNIQLPANQFRKVHCHLILRLNNQDIL